jgi:hypothetical protein
MDTNINVKWESLKERVCPHCGGYVFTSNAVILRVIPALLSPSGVAETAIQPAGFVCSTCGVLIPLRPTEGELGADVTPKNLVIMGGKA